MSYSDKVEVFNFIYRPEAGCFHEFKSKGNWECCRELWWAYDKCRKFVLSHNPGEGERIARFLEEFEDRIGLKKLSVMGPTNYEDVSWIKASSWWMSGGKMRYSLLTAILRDGVAYKKAFWKCIRDGEYLSSTEPAIRHFIDGHIQFTGKRTKWNVGWCAMFEGQSKNKVRELLVKPKGGRHASGLRRRKLSRRSK